MLSKKFTAVAGATAAAAADDNFKDTTLLLSGDGTNGAQNNTFTDGSTNNFTITRNGNTTQGTFSPYSPAGGSWSNKFTGVGNNYLKTPASSNLSFGTGDFTIEFWINTSNFSTSYYDRRIFSTGGNSSTGLQIVFPNANTITVLIDPSTILITGTTVVADGKWHHVAVTRASNSMKLFVDGVQTGSTATVTNNFTDATTNGIYISAYGGDTTNSGGVDGYLSNYRIVKGTALYTSNFTPSTTPLTAVSGTQLLTCQSNRFIDNSSNAFTLTVGSTAPSVQRFSPINPTEAYSTSTVGGSALYDGSISYLTTTYNTTAFDWWTTDYTLECWIYLTSFANWAYVDGPTVVPVLIGNSDPASTPSYFSFGPWSDGTVIFRYWNGSASNAVISSAGLVKLGQWNHITMTKTSSGIRVGANGVMTSATAISGTPQSSTSYPLTIGRINNNNITGNVCGVRIVKGTALYNASTYTIPTAPATAITNTTFLANMTNAGIYDSAMMNALETVGNAQISTSTKKYGTGSMYFDGTGDYLTAVSLPVNIMGTGDFTVEMWVYPTTVTGTYYLAALGSETTGRYVIYLVNGVLTTNFYGSSSVTMGGSVSANTWTHIAVCRSGSTIRGFVNGTLLGTTETNSSSIGNGPLKVASDASGASTLNGYIDDFRITKGYARYTSSFTAPTAALPNY